MLPKLEKKTYDAEDLRFDGVVAGKIGYMLGYDSTAATDALATAFVWETAAWKNAAQVASVAAAAAVVALTF